MPRLSNRLSEKIFTGLGPLSAFSSKIDIAFSFGMISDHERRTLHTIREIRNKFAHHDESLHFDDASLATLMAKLPIQPKKGAADTAFGIFVANIIAVTTTLQEKMTDDVLIDRLERLSGALPDK